MANLQKYPVHPDYARFPSIPFPFNGIVTAFINQWIRLDTTIRQRHVMAKARKHWVRSQDRSYFPVHEFRPDSAGAEEKLPAVIYYHGGAFVLTYASTHVANMQEYVNRVHCAVFMVDYRLAPKYVFPCGFEDCYAALKWVIKEAEWLRIDADRIAVMGDSAGGCLAAGVAQKIFDDKRINLRGQVLVYPALDNNCITFSATHFSDAPVFNGVANKKMWDVYLREYPSNLPPEYAAPTNRQNLAGLAPAYIETAEFDPLRDEGVAYGKRLREAGVVVTEHNPKGTVHGFDMLTRNGITQEALQQRSDFLKTVFS